MKLGLFKTVCILALASAQVAHAYTLGFYNITDNNAANAAAGESQLRVDVTDPGSGKIDFKFYHVGTTAMSITQIYFDDGTLLGISALTGSGSGVDFENVAAAGNLPGGNSITPQFEPTAGFTAKADAPVQPNGVGPGEWLTITFNLLSGKSYDDAVAALNAGTDLRIGIHVQGFANGGSESFVNKPGFVPIPTPDGGTTAAMLGLGLLGLGFVSRRAK